MQTPFSGDTLEERNDGGQTLLRLARLGADENAKASEEQGGGTVDAPPEKSEKQRGKLRYRRLSTYFQAAEEGNIFEVPQEVDYEQMLEYELGRGGPADSGGPTDEYGRKLEDEEGEVRDYLDPGRQNHFQHMDARTPSDLSLEDMQWLMERRLTLPGYFSAAEKENITEEVAKAFLKAEEETGLNAVFLSSLFIAEGNWSVNTYDASTNTYSFYNFNAVNGNKENAHTSQLENEEEKKDPYDPPYRSIEEGIVGGAKQILKHYIDEGQTTAYQMRWHYPQLNEEGKYVQNQYSTSVYWAAVVGNTMETSYNMLAELRGEPVDKSKMRFYYPSFK